MSSGTARKHSEPSRETVSSADCIAMEDRYGAHNYKPLDVVIASARGCWVEDVEGKRYLDCLAAYSAVNFGHHHNDIVAALEEQVAAVTLTSRAFRNDRLPFLCKELAALCGLDTVLPMNTGAEAVETAIKAARKWGYTVKGIAADRAEIIACRNNFHGRTTTIVSCSTEEQYRDGFGPFTPGFVTVDFGDVEALERAITPNTCAFLVEPIQAEAGIIVPQDGYLRRAAELCRKHNVLLIVDEIQTGLGRTGKTFCYEYDGILPDAVIVGKSLGGGILPVSAVVARKDVLGVFRPGDHGSTFGGNPLACAVALESLAVLRRERLAQRAAELGPVFMERLRTIKTPHIVEVRGRGLLIGIEMDLPVRRYCEALKERGVLCKETHDKILRIAPPLVIEPENLDWAFTRIKEVLEAA